MDSSSEPIAADFRESFLFILSSLVLTDSSSLSPVGRLSLLFWLEPLKVGSSEGIKGPISLSVLVYTLVVFFFVLLFFFSAETTVSTSPSLEDFAHCKDEMDVIIVHCGFRLCTVKLWTLNVWQNSYEKMESLEEPVRKVVLHVQVLFRL